MPVEQVREERRKKDDYASSLKLLEQLENGVPSTDSGTSAAPAPAQPQPTAPKSIDLAAIMEQVSSNTDELTQKFSRDDENASIRAEVDRVIPPMSPYPEGGRIFDWLLPTRRLHQEAMQENATQRANLHQTLLANQTAESANLLRDVQAQQAIQSMAQQQVMLPFTLQQQLNQQATTSANMEIAQQKADTAGLEAQIEKQKLDNLTNPAVLAAEADKQDAINKEKLAQADYYAAKAAKETAEKKEIEERLANGERIRKIRENIDASAAATGPATQAAMEEVNSDRFVQGIASFPDGDVSAEQYAAEIFKSPIFRQVAEMQSLGAEVQAAEMEKAAAVPNAVIGQINKQIKKEHEQVVGENPSASSQTVSNFTSQGLAQPENNPRIEKLRGLRGAVASQLEAWQVSMGMELARANQEFDRNMTPMVSYDGTPMFFNGGTDTIVDARDLQADDWSNLIDQNGALAKSAYTPEQVDAYGNVDYESLSNEQLMGTPDTYFAQPAGPEGEPIPGTHLAKGKIINKAVNKGVSLTSGTEEGLRNVNYPLYLNNLINAKETGGQSNLGELFARFEALSTNEKRIVAKELDMTAEEMTEWWQQVSSEVSQGLIGDLGTDDYLMVVSLAELLMMSNLDHIDNLVKGDVENSWRDSAYHKTPGHKWGLEEAQASAVRGLHSRMDYSKYPVYAQDRANQAIATMASYNGNPSLFGGFNAEQLTLNATTRVAERMGVGVLEYMEMWKPSNVDAITMSKSRKNAFTREVFRKVDAITKVQGLAPGEGALIKKSLEGGMGNSPQTINTYLEQRNRVNFVDTAGKGTRVSFYDVPYVVSVPYEEDGKTKYRNENRIFVYSNSVPSMKNGFILTGDAAARYASNESDDVMEFFRGNFNAEIAGKVYVEAVLRDRYRVH